jgi:AcrR family transcriptional regulator
VGGGKGVIRDCAMRLFLANGYDGTSLRDIAACTGVTPAALYYHYRTKDALLEDLLEDLFRDLDTLLQRLERDRERENGVNPARVLDGLLETLLRHRDATVLTTRDIAVGNHTVLGSAMGRNNERVSALLQRSPAAGDRILAHAALGAVLRALAQDPDLVAQTQPELVEAVTRLLGRDGLSRRSTD